MKKVKIQKGRRRFLGMVAGVLSAGVLLVGMIVRSRRTMKA